MNEVKHNGVRVTECGKEAWIVTCVPNNKNRIEGVAEQAKGREALAGVVLLVS